MEEKTMNDYLNEDPKETAGSDTVERFVIKPCPFCGTVYLRFTPNGDHDGYVTHPINDCTMSGKDVPFRLWQRRAL